jgi:hypothetical protein
VNGEPRKASLTERLLSVKAPHMLCLNRRETGWKSVPVENGNGVVLVSSDGTTSVPFISSKPNSGTEGIRQAAMAQGYAIDNPYLVESPQGELVVEPMYAGSSRPRG